jgi:hypothetical protein
MGQGGEIRRRQAGLTLLRRSHAFVGFNVVDALLSNVVDALLSDHTDPAPTGAARV